jgi:GT2 family glycosyltransferase
MGLSKFLDDLLVTIVLFEKSPDQSIAYTSLQSTAGLSRVLPAVFLYDNSPQAWSPPEDQEVTYRHDRFNSGVSKAYNEALKIAQKKNKRWMLLLDQDTHLESILFTAFIQAIDQYPESVAFVPRIQDEHGLLSPFRFSRGRGRRIPVDTGIFYLDKFRFINSGLLIKRSAFLQSGGYDENIPLDFSDIAFGERLKSTTDHFVAIPVSVKHSFSGSKSGKINIHAALARFQFFCQGAANMGKTTGSSNVYLSRAFLRACHLAYIYKSLNFFRIFLQHTVHG